MNRRDLLRAFAVGAAGLMLPVVEPARKVWALDRTMVKSGGHRLIITTDEGPFEWHYADEYMRTKKELEDQLLYGDSRIYRRSADNTTWLPTVLSEDHILTVMSGTDLTRDDVVTYYALSRSLSLL